MKRSWDKPLPVGVYGRYSVTVNEDWLEGGEITSGHVSFDGYESIVQLDDTRGNVVGNAVSFRFKGLEKGFAVAHITIKTETRETCLKAWLHVKDGC